ncbi:hypothetical protein [Undibacterium sp. Di24W]|uniref:hypothetical protein n=1 Tax=Undibacterium sp. Di24W TaxID=3413033 RepID=UPI003BF305CD
MLDLNSFDTMLGQLRESSQLHSGSVLETLAQRQKSASAFIQAMTNANEAASNVSNKLSSMLVDNKTNQATDTLAEMSQSLARPAPSNSNVATQQIQQTVVLSAPPSASGTVNLAEKNALLVNNIVQSRAISPEQQNVIDSTLRSNFTYTTQKDPVNNTLWELEDGLRRAVDCYDAAVVNAKGGMSNGVATKDGRPMYVSRDLEIQMASDKVQLARQNFETHKAFLNDPVARNKAEMAFQVTRGYPSIGGPELSAQDQLIVKEERMRRGLGV